jgi:alkylation response protein AidB-like acyl-CoA dehydrogenase
VSTTTDLGAHVSEFRAEIRQWMDENAVPDLLNLEDKDPAAMRGIFQGVWTGTSQALADAYTEWDRRTIEGRIVCAQWPEDLGGRGLGSLELLVLREETERAGMPRATRGIGEWLVGPAVIHHGTPEQKRKFLAGIRTGGDRYCQGFSEPEAGSDLANVQTRGTIDGDQIVIDGHKIWTSLGDMANMIFVLCRTETAPRHAGLSFVLVPLADNNITLRPIHQMSGLSTFTEEFFDGARAPLDNVIGGLGNGWQVAMTTLTSERGDSATTQHLAYEKEFWDLVEQCRSRGALADPDVRRKLIWAYTQTEIIRFGSWRTLGLMMSGASTGTWPWLSKLFTSEFHQALANAAVDMEGTSALVRPDGPGYATSPSQLTFLWSRAYTIFAGASQIQRNIIGERLLGLPKEPRPQPRPASPRDGT